MGPEGGPESAAYVAICGGMAVEGAILRGRRGVKGRQAAVGNRS